MSRDCCGKCRFWKLSDARGMGHCRRRPPVIPADGNRAAAAFPETSGADWCGEFERPAPDVPC